MQVYDIGLAPLFLSVSKVIDNVNDTQEFRYKFPDHAKQKEIVQAFSQKCKAGFNMVIGAIDGLLIWTLMPPLSVCRFLMLDKPTFDANAKTSLASTCRRSATTTSNFIGSMLSGLVPQVITRLG